MKIRFIQYIDTENWDFGRIVNEAGYGHVVDAEEVEEKLWSGGSRELAVEFELDTETGIIKVIG